MRIYVIIIIHAPFCCWYCLLRLWCIMFSLTSSLLGFSLHNVSRWRKGGGSVVWSRCSPVLCSAVSCTAYIAEYTVWINIMFLLPPPSRDIETERDRDKQILLQTKERQTTVSAVFFLRRILDSEYEGYPRRQPVHEWICAASGLPPTHHMLEWITLVFPQHLRRENSFGRQRSMRKGANFIPPTPAPWF